MAGATVASTSCILIDSELVVLLSCSLTAVSAGCRVQCCRAAAELCHSYGSLCNSFVQRQSLVVNISLVRWAIFKDLSEHVQ
jgi:hypothetical protein